MTTPPPAEQRPAEQPVAGYAAALDELEAILGEIDRPDVDVDVLAAKVQRAAVLIGYCRDRIGNARLQIDAVVADLDDEA